jgi:hypothetical protein
MSQLRQMIQETIAALTALDADALARLQPEVEALATMQLSPDEDLVAAMLEHRLLGKLLQETQRNLRLFRITSPCVHPSAGMALYGAFPESFPESPDAARRG